MSDERLREAERRWKESGSVDDEARYLLERVRVGDLTQERLELAAYCGHEGARIATGRSATVVSPGEWMVGLADYSNGALALGSLHAARAALREWAATGGETHAAEELLRRIEHHLNSPSGESSAAIVARIQDVTSTQPADQRGAGAHAACVAAAFVAAWGGAPRARNALVAAARTVGSEERVRHLVSQRLLDAALGSI